MKLLCVQVIKDILGNEIDVSTTSRYAVFSLHLSCYFFSIKKLLNSQRMPNMVSTVWEWWHHYGSHDLTEESDIKASIAALNFIITSAAKYSVDSESLSHELQQLGLPKG